jgi:hypothetical protein
MAFRVSLGIFCRRRICCHHVHDAILTPTIDSIRTARRYLFIAINHELFCHLDRKEEDDTNIVLPEVW